MTDSDTHTRIRNTIKTERAWWRDLVEEIGEARMNEPGPMGEWTFKDLATHLLGWRNRTIARLEAAAAGRQVPPPPWPPELDDDDAINAWIQERGRDQSLKQVLDDTDRSFDRLASAIAALPDDVLTRSDALPWLEGEAIADIDLFRHIHDEHEASIRAWLDGSR